MVEKLCRRKRFLLRVNINNARAGLLEVTLIVALNKNDREERREGMKLLS